MDLVHEIEVSKGIGGILLRQFHDVQICVLADDLTVVNGPRVNLSVGVAGHVPSFRFCEESISGGIAEVGEGVLDVSSEFNSAGSQVFVCLGNNIIGLRPRPSEKSELRRRKVAPSFLHCKN